MLKAREAVRKLKAYQPPLGNRDGLRLDFNENTVGCSPRVLQRLRQLTAEQLARYPERRPLEAVVAAHVGVKPKEVLLTNGTDEAIHMLCEAYLEPDDEAIIVVPTYSMYELYAAATGAKVIAVPAGKNFKFSADTVLSRITARTSLIAVANPNNPTGTFAPLADIIRISEAAPHAALLVDEAYFEFCGKTIVPKWRAFPTIFVSRTFSKAYGMAGLRVGALMGNAEQMQVLRGASSPYNVNAAALACLPEALADQEFIRRYVDDVTRGREKLQQELHAWGIHYWPSEANFVLLHLDEHCASFISAMREHGILVRDRSSDPGCKDCVRITLGTAGQNERLFTVLREVFEYLGITGKVMQ